MNASEELKQDLRDGRIDLGQFVDLFVAQQHDLQAAKASIAELQKCNDELQKQNQELTNQLGAASAQKLSEPFSMRSEEQRQAKRRQKRKRKQKSKRRGRVTTAQKIAQAKETRDVFPEGVPAEKCTHSHTRPVWRLDQGKAVLIAYRIYRSSDGQYGKIPGVMGRSEFALDVVLTMAHLVYEIGLSFDKVCQVLSFFQDFKLAKSQVDSLLHQLARHWRKEFDILCTLLANAAVVHTDETGWSFKSVWAFLSEQARIVLHGVPKDAETLKKVLDWEKFLGIVISDDAAVYANFTKAQKCWAHLLRKAIKLTLHDPDNPEYRDFTDRLLELYGTACRVQRDGRLSAAGRMEKVAELEVTLREVCAPMWLKELPPQAGVVNDYRLLVNELMRLLLAKELFTFVTAKPVEQPNGEKQPVAGTNNEAERTLRSPAQARDTGRTNKTVRGARRQTILTSVLESLRLYLPEFTLKSVVSEIERWWQVGRSCFAELLEKRQLSMPEESILDKVLPVPSG